MTFHTVTEIDSLSSSLECTSHDTRDSDWDWLTFHLVLSVLHKTFKTVTERLTHLSSSLEYTPHDITNSDRGWLTFYPVLSVLPMTFQTVTKIDSPFIQSWVYSTWQSRQWRRLTHLSSSLECTPHDISDSDQDWLTFHPVLSVLRMTIQTVTEIDSPFIQSWVYSAWQSRQWPRRNEPWASTSFSASSPATLSKVSMFCQIVLVAVMCCTESEKQ